MSTRHSWEWHDTFVKPHCLTWITVLSTESLGTLLHGFTPVEMEDKWFIYTNGPDTSGAATVNFYHSWTRENTAELAVKIAWGEDSATELWSGRIVELTVETEIKYLALEDSAGLMDKMSGACSC